MDGGDATIELDVKKLYAVWQDSQKLYVHRPQVEIYKKQLREGTQLKPIFLEYMDFNEDGNLYVRTGDGRHRLAATFESGIEKIRVVRTDLAVQAKDILGL